MDLWNIVKTVGTGLISTMVPGGPLIVAGINAALPDDKKLPENATGVQAMEAIESLPLEERAAVINKQYDVEITQIKESHDTVKTMLTMDAVNPHSTRPKIAYQAFQLLATIMLIVISLWAYAVGTGNNVMVKTIQDGWPWMATFILPVVGWINAYFGKLVTEQKNKLDAVNGATTPAGIAGIVSTFLKR